MAKTEVGKQTATAVVVATYSGLGRGCSGTMTAAGLNSELSFS